MLVSGSRILAPAYAGGFAIPAFNISDWGMLRASLAECESIGSPMIVSIHPAEWELVGDEFVASVLELARNASVPVAVQLDHGASYAQVIAAIRLGFTGVMFDGSLLPYDENVARTREIVAAAHLAGVSVEGEVGTIGPRDITSAEQMAEIVYTTPEEAAAFVAATGVDYLAVAVGTCHGVYPAGVEPNLQLDLISELRAAIPGVPMVLHGGSGTPDDQVTAAVGRGVAKVNLSADLKVPFFRAIRELLADPALREPHDIYPPALDVVADVVRHKVEVVRSGGTAGSYDLTPVGTSTTRWTEDAVAH